MGIRNSSYLSNGTDERAVVIYDNYSTYLIDDTVTVIKGVTGTAKDNSYRAYIDELFNDGSGYRFIDPPPPDWAGGIPTDPPPFPA